MRYKPHSRRYNRSLGLDHQIGSLIMAMNEMSSDTPQTPATKKPYEKPSFRYEQVFVTTALSCGKIWHAFD